MRKQTTYREIPGDRVLTFPATPGFRGWEAFFTPDSTAHPAKMNLRLLSWILETFTSPGDVVLDPMAGTGSTVILAALMGRHGVAVEYEPRFCDMIRGNIELALRQRTLAPKGGMVCIQGDARELSKLLRGSDAVITSPPYEGSVPACDERWLEEHWDDESDSPKHKTMRFGRSMRGYPRADAVVTSPPYGNRLADDVVDDGDEGRMSYRQAIDSIVTSPPYEQGLRHRGQDYEEVREKLLAQGYSEEYIRASWSQPHQCQRWAEEAYGEDSNNIGNLKSENYLEAMLQVYRECWKVLRQSGKLILVTKNFIRDRAVVRLDLDTIRLCEAAGFRLADRWYFRLPTRSFWKILYRRRYPDVPEVEHEDVLVFDKGVDIQRGNVK